MGKKLDRLLTPRVVVPAAIAMFVAFSLSGLNANNKNDGNWRGVVGDVGWVVFALLFIFLFCLLVAYLVRLARRWRRRNRRTVQ